MHCHMGYCRFLNFCELLHIYVCDIHSHLISHFTSGASRRFISQTEGHKDRRLVKIKECTVYIFYNQTSDTMQSQKNLERQQAFEEVFARTTNLCANELLKWQLVANSWALNMVLFDDVCLQITRFSHY